MGGRSSRRTVFPHVRCSDVMVRLDPITVAEAAPESLACGRLTGLPVSAFPSRAPGTQGRQPDKAGRSIPQRPSAWEVAGMRGHRDNRPGGSSCDLQGRSSRVRQLRLPSRIGRTANPAPARRATGYRESGRVRRPVAEWGWRPPSTSRGRTRRLWHVANPRVETSPRGAGAGFGTATIQQTRETAHCFRVPVPKVSPRCS